MNGPSADEVSQTSVTIRRGRFAAHAYEPAVMAAAWELLEDRTLPEVSELVLAARFAARHVIGWGTALAVLLAVFVWWLVPPVYRAVSLIQVGKSQALPFAQSLSEPNEADYLRSQEQRLLAKPLLDAAWHRSEVQAFLHVLPPGQQAQWIREQLIVEALPEAGLLSVSFRYPSAEVALAFTTAITNAYLEDHQNSLVEDRMRRLAELEQAAKQADHRLNATWNQLQALADQIGSASSPQMAIREQLQSQTYRTYAQQLRGLQLTKQQLEHLVIAAEAEAPAVDVADQVRAIVNADEQVQAKREELAQLESQLSTLKRFVAHPNLPRVVDLRQQRDLVAEQLSELQSELEKRAQEQLLEGLRAERAAELQKLNQQLAANAQEIAFLNDMMTQLEATTAQSGNGQGVTLEMLRRTIDRQTRLSDDLWKALENQKLAAQAEPRVSLLEPASLPAQASRREQLKAVMAVSLGGMLATVLCFGWVEWKSCRIRQPQDVLLRCGLQILGIGASGRGSGIGYLTTQLTTQVTQAGVNEAVTMAAARGLPARLFVSCADDREPSDQVALQLAMACDHCGYRTLLVDADPEAGRLRRALGGSPSPTAGRWAVNSSTSNAAATDVRIQPTSSTGVEWCELLVDATPDRPGSVAERPRQLGELLTQVAAEYQAVVVLGPPLLTTPDSVLLAAKCEFSVVAIDMGASRWDRVQAARQRLEVTPAKLLGAIVCRSGERSWSAGAQLKSAG